MNTLLIDCPHCSREIRVPANVETTCPKCRNPVIAEAPVLRAQAKRPKAAKGSPWLLLTLLSVLVFALFVVFMEGFALDAGFLMNVCGVAAGSFIYFIPTVIASSRGAVSKNMIFVLNLLLGVTVIGWIAAFIWAAVDKPAQS
jgi:hypothetical protein